MAATHNLLALDVGERRVGVAIASRVARLPRPHTTLERNEQFWQELKGIIEQEQIGEIIIGLPRSLEGHETDQTKSTRQFAEELKHTFNLPIYFQDEALTSHQAESLLRQTDKLHTKAAIDSLAATLILEDFLNHPSEAMRHD